MVHADDLGHMASAFTRQTPRPYDLPCVQIRKSDDMDNACAKSLVLQVLLAQSFAMQIISMPTLSGGRRTHHSPMAVPMTVHRLCPARPLQLVDPA
jgi:hypothetical protein